MTSDSGSAGAIGRRGFLRGAGAVAGALALGDASTARADDNTLSLLSWPGHGDPAVVGPFEQNTA